MVVIGEKISSVWSINQFISFPLHSNCKIKSTNSHHYYIVILATAAEGCNLRQCFARPSITFCNLSRQHTTTPLTKMRSASFHSNSIMKMLKRRVSTPYENQFAKNCKHYYVDDNETAKNFTLFVGNTVSVCHRKPHLRKRSSITLEICFGPQKCHCQPQD